MPPVRRDGVIDMVPQPRRVKRSAGPDGSLMPGERLRIRAGAVLDPACEGIQRSLRARV